MKFKQEKEIRGLGISELADYSMEFLEYFKYKHPLLESLVKKLPTNQNLRNQVEQTLIAAHNKKKVWQITSVDDSEKESVNTPSLIDYFEESISSLEFNQQDFSLINPTVFNTIRDGIKDLLLTVTEDDPDIIETVLEKMLNKSFFRSQGKFDKILDRIYISEGDYRQNLHDFTAFYHDKKEAKGKFNKLFDMMGLDNSQRTKFNKECRQVIKLVLEKCYNILQDREFGLPDIKISSREVDKIWRKKNRFNSPMVTNLENMLLIGNFRLSFKGQDYFNLDKELHQNIDSYEITLLNITKVLDLISGVFRKEIEFQDSAREARTKFENRLNSEVEKLMKFAAATEVPEQNMVLYHFLLRALRKPMLSLFTKAFEDNNEDILALFKDIEKKYNDYRGIDSPFYKKDIIDYKQQCLLLETGSPLHFCLEAGLVEEAKQLAKDGKYLDCRSRSLVESSNDKLPSEFASSINLDKSLINFLQEQETKFATKSNSSGIKCEVVISSNTLAGLNAGLAQRDHKNVKSPNQEL